ncbi:MAG: zinc-finger domain protein [Siphoviridae sp. cttb18]|nr:MAG: zinc-finger domain protein [Siphoviridae sp. cttb18]
MKDEEVREIICEKCHQKIQLYYDFVDGIEYEDGEIGHAKDCDKRYQSN